MLASASRLAFRLALPSECGIPKQGCLLSHSFMCCRYYAILPSARPGSAPRIGSTRRSASVRKGDALYAVLPLIGILSCRVDVMGCDRTRIYRGNGLELRYLCRCNARASRSSVLYSTAEHSTRQASDTRGFMGDWDPTGQLYEICIEPLHQPSPAQPRTPRRIMDTDQNGLWWKGGSKLHAE